MGVTDELVQECLGVMINWVELLRLTIRAECPGWELTQAFQCMSLTKQGAKILDDDEKGQRYVMEAG